MGASMALAGATACTRQPDEAIIPYVRTPEDVVPGKPLFFATTMTLAGVGAGLLAESHEGRPTKLEGNPDHPSSSGATDALGQGAVLTLYDPDRSQSITYLGEARPWASFSQAMQNQLAELKALNGAGLRFLSSTVGSPTLGAQVKEILAALPGARWHQYEAVSRENVYGGAALAFGEPADVHYKLDQADVIVVLDADLFGAGVAGNVRYARDFANGRRIRKATAEMNRLYVAEPTPTAAGSIADHRLPFRASQMEAAARAILAGVEGGAVPSLGEAADKFFAAAVKDLVAAKGKGVVIVGDRQPAAVHAVAHAINQSLGNIGTTVVLTDPIAVDATSQTASLTSLVADMNAGQVQLLVMLDVNPVFTAPVDLDFASALKKVRTRVHAGLFDDETAELSQWHVPTTHFLEEWSDARAHDGTASIVQPLILPLYQGKSLHEVAAVFSAKPERNGLDVVKEFWQAQPQAAGQDFTKFWRKSVHDGVIAALGAPRQVRREGAGAAGLRAGGRQRLRGRLRARPDDLRRALRQQRLAAGDAEAAHEDHVGQRRAGLAGDGVETRREERRQRRDHVEGPHAAGARVAAAGTRRRGADGVPRPRAQRARAASATASATTDTPSARRMRRRSGSARRSAAPAASRSSPRRRATTRWKAGRSSAPPRSRSSRRTRTSRTTWARKRRPRRLTLYNLTAQQRERTLAEHAPTTYAWGMAIDQSVCTGCSACVVACYAENNIPVIGKEQVLRGREMAWIRIDRYFEGDADNPAIYHQPMLCQQCENAPCEVVCPVAATTHSSEGLNDMVYNRCVGTRYCSNNCPYKVRRFNFLLYSDWDTTSYKLQRNPNVTVRSRGVMEKCTYCVQRINRARQDSKVEGRTIQDGEIKTACQQACPTDAIVFGDINDPDSRVSQLKAESTNYGVLAELNTHPRTTYLAQVKNPNAALETELPGMEKEEPRALPKVPGKDMSETNSMTHAPR